MTLDITQMKCIEKDWGHGSSGGMLAEFKTQYGKKCIEK
jgi:hypothetical protein